jgi:hypothetical protein
VSGEPGWVCGNCGQRNAQWSAECGRCEAARPAAGTLTLRQHFAGLALQGQLAALGWDDAAKFNELCKRNGVTFAQGVARMAAECADELIAALEAKP